MKVFIKNIRKTIHSIVIEYSIQIDPNRNSTEQLFTFLIKKLLTSKVFNNIKSINVRLSEGKIIIKFKNKKPPK